METEDLVNGRIVNCGYLINSAGETLDYDKVTDKLDISPNNSSFIEFTKQRAAIFSYLKLNKNYQLPENHDHLFAF